MSEGLGVWLREQIEARRALACGAVPGPWRWGDWSAGFGMPEVERNVLECSPEHGLFPAPVRLREAEAAGVLRLEGSLECDPEREVSALHIAANDPRDTIARCEAELGILDEHRGEPSERGGLVCMACGHDDGRLGVAWPCRTVRLLGTGYKYRDGYREEWAP